MSFRARLALVAAAAVALAVVAASAVVYVVVRDQLYSSTDDSLRNSMHRIVDSAFEFVRGPPQPGVFGGYPQVVDSDGDVFRAPARNWRCRSTSACKRWPAVSEGRSSRTRTQKGHMSA